MKGFVDDIEKRTEENTDFRRVLDTGHNLQLALMSIDPGEEIGEEVHDDRDRFFRIEAGEGEVSTDGVVHKVRADDGIVVPRARPTMSEAWARRLSGPALYANANHSH